MKRYFPFSILIVLLGLITPGLFSQSILPFGDLTLEDLSRKPYKPDPGADAIILSDIGIAKLSYFKGFYVELERDVRIKIVNSNGYDYANIEIPYSIADNLDFYRASTFNTVNGEKTETKIPKKSFIIENTSKSYNTLKFNFPDVHEGSVVEYSYRIRLKNSSVNVLVPWKFQSDIPVILSSLTVKYPDTFIYKTIISGSAKDVQSRSLSTDDVYLGESVMMNTITWFVQDLPAFRNEPHIMSKKEHLTKITFELLSADLPNSSIKEITPTYETLAEKLLLRDDFGKALKTNFRSLVEQITMDQKDNLSKLRKIHEYISSKILWNGIDDYTTSSSLKNVMRKEKGNSADINIMLIAMLRSLGIKADPVILSTRSNGSLNQFSAMIQQFNYVVAYVTVEGESYLVDATDPLRPFGVLPFECLNGAGRLISDSESKFVELKNSERKYTSGKLDLTLDTAGNLTGMLENIYSDYSAYVIRKLVNLESEEGYLDIVKSVSPNAEISDFEIENLENRNGDLTEKYNIKISYGAQILGDEIIFKPFLSLTGSGNQFSSPERKFPVDFGCPIIESYSLKLNVPDGYSVVEKPENFTQKLGQNAGKFEFSCNQSGNILEIKSELNISKTIFQPSEYSAIRSFYSKMLQKQAEHIVLKKDII